MHYDLRNWTVVVTAAHMAPFQLGGITIESLKSDVSLKRVSGHRFEFGKRRYALPLVRFRQPSEHFAEEFFQSIFFHPIDTL